MKDEKHEFGILFVDDEEQALKYFRRAFEREFPIFSATSAREAKAILKAEGGRISILITDQRMPEEKGVELLKYSRKEYPKIIRILTTGFTDLDDAIEAVNSGEIHRYITKPWDLSSLRVDLKQSAQFFQLRNERDELLREKLSVWQRLQGVNRVREMVALASGCPIIRNAPMAIQAFIEQIPMHDEQSASPTLGSWEALAGELREFYRTGREVVEAIQDRIGEPPAACPLENLLEPPASSALLQRVVMDGSIRGLRIEGCEPLLRWAFASLLEWAMSSAQSGKAGVAAAESNGVVEARISVEGGSWNGASLLAFPPELLGAYFACYHHFGELKIGSEDPDRLVIIAALPKRQSGQTEGDADFSWLDRSLIRFENW